MRNSPSVIEPADARRAPPVLADAARTGLLLASLFLFMWMFFASKALERTAAEGRFVDVRGVDIPAAADEYAYLWRHGMIGGWPLYVPGFFAVAVAMVMWSRGRSVGAMARRGALILLTSTVVAKVLAPVGTERLVPAFARYVGTTANADPLGATWDVAPVGLVTVVSWASLIVAIRVSLAARSIRPLILPLALYSGLAILRPGALGELVEPWASRFLRGDRVAVTSTALLGIGLVVLCRSERAVVSSCQTENEGS